MESAVTLFPEPLSPTRQSVSPARMERDKSFTARTAFSPRPNSRVRIFISSRSNGCNNSSAGFDPGINPVIGNIHEPIERDHESAGEKNCAHNHRGVQRENTLHGQSADSRQRENIFHEK